LRVEVALGGYRLGICFFYVTRFRENCLRVGFISREFLLKEESVKEGFPGIFTEVGQLLKTSYPNLKPVLINADFVIEGYVDSTESLERELHRFPELCR
jgi:hypothetical protein